MGLLAPLCHITLRSNTKYFISAPVSIKKPGGVTVAMLKVPFILTTDNFGLDVTRTSSDRRMKNTNLRYLAI